MCFTDIGGLIIAICFDIQLRLLSKEMKVVKIVDAAPQLC